MIDMVIENQTLRVATGVLNEILMEATAMQQPPSDKGKRLEGRGTETREVIDGRMKRAIEAVSYTHLDVYKRQLATSAAPSFGCLIAQISA